MNKSDPMREVFDVLKARSRERVNFDLDLEDRLMNVHDQQRQKRSRVFKMAVFALVGLLVTGTAAEAATGVISSMIKRVTLDTGNGPQVITDYQATVNSDGSETVTVTLPEGQTSGTVTVESIGL